MPGGDGSPTREFLYVGNTARVLVRAAARYEDLKPDNLGTEEEIAIRELGETIAELTGFDGRIRWDTSKPNGQPRRCLDTSRAKERFGFEAETAFQEGLRQTIDWYLSSMPDE